MEARAILDWGCGCGRVFQYIPFKQRAHLTGIDIVADNVEWCAKNFPEARFETVPLLPPTKFGAATFDLVFAISVLTHLTEESQLAWLAELGRITAPGATVLLSVHGETAWLLGGTDLARYGEWRSKGFLVIGKNDDLDGSGVDSSQYYNSFISREYIFKVWSRYFKVMDVLGGAVNSIQDLVVLKKI